MITIFNNEPINVRMLIEDNIKYMDETPQRTYGHLCVINELWRLAGVLVQPDDVMVIPIIPVNISAMKIISTHPTK